MKKKIIKKSKNIIFQNVPVTKKISDEINYQYHKKRIGPKYKKMYLDNPANLTSLQQSIVSDVETKGISIFDLNKLGEFGIQTLEALKADNEKFLNGSYLKNKREMFRNNIHDASNKKQFVGKMSIERNSKWEKDSILDFGINEFMLNIANSYLQTFTKLNLVDLWCNFAVKPEDVPSFSQKWHRDYEDKKILKVFLYLNDVDESNGPFSFIPESHYNGKFGEIWQTQYGFNQTGSVYPDNEEFLEKFGNKQKVCVGSAGTMIFCDTNGFHKGGFCKEERHLATWTFVPPSSTCDYYSSFDNIDSSQMTLAQKVAINHI